MVLAALAGAGVLVRTAPAEAQGRLSPVFVEVNGGIGVPAGSFTNGVGSEFTGRSSAGVGFGILAGYPLSTRVSVLAGYSRQRFGLERWGRWGGLPSPPVRERYELVDAGGSLGVRLSLAPRTGAAPWLQGGLLYHQFSWRWPEVGGSGTGERAVGVEMGGGFSVPFGNRWSIGPGLLYRTYSWSDRQPNYRGPTPRLTYVRFQLATRYRF